MRAALFLLAIALAACKKEAPSDDRIEISGITTMDANGVSMGAADPDDWTFDANWNARTLALFQAPSASDLTGANAADIHVYPAYPNPGNGTFHWGGTATLATHLQLVFTNDRLEVLQRNSFPVPQGGWQVAFQLPENNFPSGTYRLHYAFYDVQGRMYYKGHGDVRVQR